MEARAGLTATEAARRLAEVGPNELPREGATPRWKLFLAQFASPMIWLLLAAAVLAFALGEVVDAVAIAAILLINAVVGFLQEARAEAAVLALRSLTAPRARVLREGHAQVIPAAEVVPGDLLLLEAGDVVAADARILEAHQLRSVEASLTGESLPVEKSALAVDVDAPLAERSDRVFLGTSIAAGTGLAEVECTGARTEMGKIAGLLASAESGPTPLQQRLERVTRSLIVASLVIVAAVAILGLLRERPWLEVLLTSVSLAVAAVPEGLPAVVTIALALGVQRMASRNVLIRRLPAVETLGSTTVICTDKTGTLTAGRMAARDLFGPERHQLLFAAAACCDADLASNTGDPTELAILEAARERGIEREAIERERPRREVTPFDSERKWMSIRRDDGVLYVKGAVDVLLPLCSAGTEGIAAANEDMASRGLRVLAVAVGSGTEARDLEMLGLIGLADPPRPEVIEALARARAAGIRTVMITGDHPVTARAIARELGLLQPGEDPAELVHARVTAEEKIRIVQAWKARGAVVAMTGDGINDAPALRAADVGIAMGVAGTEVTREAADLVLADDNYASIVAGVAEGRAIYENIRKTLVYLLAGNAGELALMFVAAALGMPVPLLPVQLLWINLVTDGMPALALVMDPGDPRVLERPPHPLAEPMLGRREWRRVLLTGCLEALVTLGVFFVGLEGGEAHARTLAFTTLVFAEVLRSFAARDPDRLLWEVGAFSNLKLIGVVLLTFALQLSLLFVPAFRVIFGLEAVGPAAIAAAIAVAFVPVSALELSKLARRLR